MSRYIDADALKIPETSVDMFENCRNCRLLDKEQVQEIIDDAPSIDIVFCKECTERDDDWCMYFGNVINPDDFCSCGEREGE